ncbi:hypothetical protein PC129_g17467 [Phytophthora cactorum]|uniref:RNase H type-1 domain-containing protein n=1 Tax=Phytophthora cactorum TaxID=29920 RepID=A0A329RPJ0_9STRA|nr:hypothetical protein Pcac1_g14963 [Phytophthora cactorum]KAG2815354.1 hypothetical protein PC112_g13918 [Phytophthora cactorum]KAG2816745.1 hypothetical protein PC111_g13023 [Phytophthora cactorum]KAG2853105.1 hypothetical protein PC113_g14456 [Phytophthora cactorum]KAG2895196.1 hypothetical protein PC114_g15587 [Phytophthora cactorum]
MLRVGFFDGGSRGNPGAGGSGSVVVERNSQTGELEITWLVATSLRTKTTTNNVAEFIGLFFLLSDALRSLVVSAYDNLYSAVNNLR